MSDEPRLRLDDNSFHELAPVDQALCLLALIYMSENDLTLEDIMEVQR